MNGLRTNLTLLVQSFLLALLALDLVPGSTGSARASFQFPSTLDGTFNPGTGPDDDVLAIALQPDGRILLGGDFDNFDRRDRSGIARLNSDGSLDLTFAPNPGANGSVYTVAFQTNGQVLIGGSFTQVSHTPRTYLARLNTDGSLDTNFNPLLTGELRAIVVQPDQRILIGGLFLKVDGQSRPTFAQLQPDGALDPAFPQWDSHGSPFNNDVFAIVLQPDDLILVGGQFHSQNGISRPYLERIHGDPAAVTFALSTSVFSADEQTGTLTVTVRRNGDNRNPVSVDYTTRENLAEEHSAIAGGDYLHQSGTLQFEALESTKIISIPILNDGNVEPEEPFLIVLTNTSPGTAFGLPRQADVWIEDNDAPFRFETASKATNEDAGTALVKVLRDTSIGDPATVQFFTEDFTALAGHDYASTNGTLSFAAGESSKTLAVRIVADDLTEISEIFFLHLTNAVGATLGSIRRTAVELVDASGSISLQYADFSAQENQAAAEILVLRTGQTLGSISVDYSTADLTAISGLDYTATAGTLTFTNGETAKTVPVPILNDGLVEETEQLWFTLSRPSPGATLGPHTNRPVYIYDNDHGIEFMTAQVYASERARQATLRLSRGDDGTNTLTLRYHTSPGTALPGQDYAPVPDGLLSLRPGNTPLLLTLSLLADSTPEPAETFSVSLSDPSPGGSFKTITQAVVVVLDGSGPASVDGSFHVDLVPDWVGVRNIALQPDGRIVFNQSWLLNLEHTYRFPVARLLADGTADPSFQPEYMAHNGIYGLALQPDGKILYSSMSHAPDGAIGARSLRRILPNGGCDPDFLESCTGPIFTQFWLGWGKTVMVQPNGQVLLGGLLEAWTQTGTVTCGLERHHPDGTLDTNFGRLLPPNVRALALQPDGAILAGGDGILCRLHPDGSRDDTFHAQVNFGSTNEPGFVAALLLLPNSQVIAGGSFNRANGIRCSNLARFNPDGTLDTAWTTNATANSEVYALAGQRNGRVVVGGAFTWLNGVSRSCLGRLNPDGSLDLTFDPGLGPDGAVNTLALQPDGRILVGGAFSQFDGLPFAGLVRLMGDTVPYCTAVASSPEGIRLTIACDPGQTIEVQASQDLTRWTSIQTHVPTTDRLEVLDPDAPQFPRRFYRTALTPP